MPTTTNYGWTTPADTDLVKDGAAAIRTLGTAIDTTTYNNANAAIAKTIVDAKGDIIAATAADTVSRLAVGANDTVLTADSSTATGLKWATASSGGMTLLSTTTLSGTSTTISGISGSYNSLKILINNVNLSANQIFRIRLNDEGALATYVGTDGSTASSTTVGFDGAIIANAQQMRASSSSNDFVLQVDDYASSTDFKAWQLYGGYDGTDVVVYPSFVGGIFKSNTAISSIKFTTNGIVTFNGGTVRIYGVK